ncbi:MAG: DEAD/DEAH box helicase, partial [Rhodococcus sp.]|nr:DEAD/DEAH box helicase [Rhodococcus sp. (in: high G+C Gram-positive bacteria)]
TTTAVDEADHLAQLGFLPQVTEILDDTPKDSQRLLFSATLDGDVGSLVSRYLREPVSVATDVDASPDRMTHHVLVVEKADKLSVVERLARGKGLILLFTQTQAWADRLTEKLLKTGVPVDVLHGGKSQAYRTGALARFTGGSTPVLVATDVAARGIHVDDVALVVHADAPTDSDSYVHRAGRTARAGATGTVVTVVTPSERDAALKVIAGAGIDAAVHRVSGKDPLLEQLAGTRKVTRTPVAPPIDEKAAKALPTRVDRYGREKPTGVKGSPNSKSSWQERKDAARAAKGTSRRGGPKPGSRTGRPHRSK